MHKNAGKTILLSMIIFLVFLVTGCPNPVNDTSTQDVAAAKEALAVGYSEGDAAASVTANVTLASSGEKEVTITWTSDNAAVGTTGVVTRPKTGESDVTVTLTATLTKNTVSDTKTFTLTVKALPDTTPPAEVTDIKGTAGDTEVTLCWTNPTDADFAGVKISAEGIEEITVTKETTTSSITGLTNGKEYTFTVKTYDTIGNVSTGTTVKVMSVTAIPPKTPILKKITTYSNSILLVTREYSYNGDNIERVNILDDSNIMIQYEIYTITSNNSNYTMYNSDNEVIGYVESALNPSGLVTEENHLDPSRNLVSTVTYDYDSLGKIIKITTTQGVTTLMTSYEYNILGKIEKETITANAIPQLRITYTHSGSISTGFYEIYDSITWIPAGTIFKTYNNSGMIIEEDSRDVSGTSTLKTVYEYFEG